MSGQTNLAALMVREAVQEQGRKCMGDLCLCSHCVFYPKPREEIPGSERTSNGARISNIKGRGQEHMTAVKGVLKLPPAGNLTLTFTT